MWFCWEVVSWFRMGDPARTYERLRDLVARVSHLHCQCRRGRVGRVYQFAGVVEVAM